MYYKIYFWAVRCFLMCTETWKNRLNVSLAPYASELPRIIIFNSFILNMTLHYVFHVSIFLVDQYSNIKYCICIWDCSYRNTCFSDILFPFLIKLYHLLSSRVRNQNACGLWAIIYFGILSTYCVVMKLLVFLHCAVYCRVF